MTVPGRGGRPRKWRSDADRVRAWRARQAGDPEPPQLADVDADSDELARRVEEVRQLSGQLRDVRQENRAATAELNRARRRIALLEQQVDQLIVANSEATWEVQSLRRTIDGRSHVDPATDRELFAGEAGGDHTLAPRATPESAHHAPDPAAEAPNPTSEDELLYQRAANAAAEPTQRGRLNRAERRRLQRQKRKR